MDAASNSTRRVWSIAAALLMACVFAQAAFAGAMLSGEEWARPAHKLGSIALMIGSLLAGLAAITMLRQVPHGLKLGFMLLGLAAASLLQNAIGVWSANGANLLWVHVPLGVALAGLAGQALSNARHLGCHA